jgi:hypothetical protein
VALFQHEGTTHCLGLDNTIKPSFGRDTTAYVANSLLVVIKYSSVEDKWLQLILNVMRMIDFFLVLNA